MSIKKLIKKLGRFFIVLKEEEGNTVKQTILIVDNGYSGFEHLFSGIKGIKGSFPQAELLVMTFEHRRAAIEKEFGNLGFITPPWKLGLNRYRIALAMLGMHRRKLDFILLFSLDVSPLATALFFINSKIILCNQWGQWWSVRLRNVSEIFKITYASKIKSFNLKNLLKKIGLFFVLLEHNDIASFKRSLLIVDNGYATYEQIHCAILRVSKTFLDSRITVLTFREELKNEFPELELIEPDGFVFKKYKIANAMLSLHKCYDDVVLLSLDITPILVSFLFIHSNVFLYNKWHQWWSIKPRPLRDYLMAIPRIILHIIVNVAIFVYLLANVSWVFFKKSFNVFKDNLLGIKLK